MTNSLFKAAIGLTLLHSSAQLGVAAPPNQKLFDCTAAFAEKWGCRQLSAIESNIRCLQAGKRSAACAVGSEGIYKNSLLLRPFMLLRRMGQAVWAWR